MSNLKGRRSLIFARIASSCVGLIGLSLAYPSTAQTSTPQDIVVHAQRPIERETAKQMITTLGRDSHEQLARFNDPVCPSALGLTPAINAAIESEFRATAAGVGARVDSAKCEPNILIIVTDKPTEVVKRMRGQTQLDGSGRRLSRDLASGAAAVAWSRTELQNEDGEGPQAHTVIQGLNGVAYDIGPSIPLRSATIIGASTQAAVKEAFVVIDLKVAIGKTPVQLADYAVMRTLTETGLPPSGQAQGETILTLAIEGASVPQGLSSFDRQYLTALYKIKPTQSLMQQRSAILSALVTPSQDHK